DATTPRTRLFCRQKRTSSRCHRVAAGRIKLLIDGCSGFAHEDIFERRLVQADRIDCPGKGFHNLGDETMAVGNLYAHLTIHHGRLYVKTLCDSRSERLRVGGLQHHYIAADARPQFLGSPLSYDLSLVQEY